MPELQLLVVTPEKTLLDCRSESVVVTLVDGAKGFLSGHAPLIGRLGPGVLKVQQPSGDRRYFLDGGFVQMDHNVLSVLTNFAIPVEDLNAVTLEKELADLQQQLPVTPADKLARQRQLTRTRAMLQATRSE